MAVTFDQLSPDQVHAIEEAVRWYNNPRSRYEPFRIFGAAGTGKTTVAHHVLNALGTTVQALAPTNRAARILRDKGVERARTLHSVLFRPTPWCVTENHQIDSRCSDEKNTRKHEHNVRFFKREDPPEGIDCFTVDEASMVGRRIGDDIRMFGKPTLVIGDPYQLPPVGDEPAYDSSLPGVELQYSHRFDSESDIAYLANRIRMSSGLKDWHNKLPYVGFDQHDDYDLILAWRNDTRWNIIDMMRAIKGKKPDMPEVGDRLISVANTYEVGVLNADELTVIDEPYPSVHNGAINIPTAEAGIVAAWKAGFRDFEGEKFAATYSRRKGSEICALTFSECMTVHKAQGGEWPRVLVVDDLNAMNWTLRNERGAVNTWAYTAVTRASERVDFIKIGEFPTGMKLRQMIAANGAS